MKFYPAKDLTLEQKQELSQLIINSDPNVVKLHDWVFGDTEDFSLYYVQPKDRHLIKMDGDLVTSTESFNEIMIYETIAELDGFIPVDSTALIELINEYTNAFDVMFQVKE